MHGLRAITVIGAIAVILCCAIQTSHAQPMIRLDVSEEIARQGNLVPIAIEIENLGDSIRAFQLRLSLDRPDLIAFRADTLSDTCYQCSDSACTAFVAYPCTTRILPLSVEGTLTEDWEYIEARMYGEFDLRVTGICDLHFPEGPEPILPFTNGVLVKVIAEVFCEIPYELEDRTVMAIISPTNTFFSNASGDLIEPLELTDGWVGISYTEPGDLDGNDFRDAFDLGKMIDLLFASGPDPCPACVADLNCDGFADPLDLARLIDYLLAGGVPPPQCPGCG